MTSKISIRFYRNWEDRILRDVNNSDLGKRKLEPVSATNQLNTALWLTEVQLLTNCKGLKLTPPALTSKINDREMFMKGIDYSYIITKKIPRR